MTPRKDSDEYIIQKIRAGNNRDEHEIVSLLMRSYRGLVHTIVLRPGLGTAQDVQDVLNDAISDLLNQVKSETFQLQNTRLSTFFYALARNRWLNVLRSRAKQVSTTTIPANRDFNGQHANPVLREIIAEEQRIAVHQALQKIDSPCFAILYRYWIKDMKLKDIAAEMGITEGAVKKRHERCRRKLKAFLQKDPRKY